MGLFDKLLPSRQAVGMLLADPDSLNLVSPWAGSNLSRVVLADLAGIKTDDVSRADAMAVPAVARGRGLICGHLSRLPLKLWDVAAEAELPTPTWLTSTHTLQSPRARLLWTLDDLIFTGLSLWAVERDADGAITDAIRVPRVEWTTDPDTLGVLVRGVPITDPRQVILFEGSQEGLCVMAALDIRGALDMGAAWRQRVAAPVPNIALKQTDPNDQLVDDEIDELVTDWEAARRAGGTAFLPYGVDAEALGQVVSDLYIEGRNAGRLDIANYLQIPANMLEGSMATASLTYTTTEGRRSDFIDTCLAYWAQPIESRLSQDDVCPDGTAVRFDFSGLVSTVQPTHQTSTED
ncbi:MAG: phage portal protein [Micropruina sp.]|uniref:phage portal protein n=1 Tax=Micropruina sp. TaxID=2737536 RepID=UPI0039E3A7EF